MAMTIFSLLILFSHTAVTGLISVFIILTKISHQCHVFLSSPQLLWLGANVAYWVVTFLVYEQGPQYFYVRRITGVSFIFLDPMHREFR